MSDGARCHYCRKVPCVCEDAELIARVARGLGWAQHEDGWWMSPVGVRYGSQDVWRIEVLPPWLTSIETPIKRDPLEAGNVTEVLGHLRAPDGKAMSYEDTMDLAAWNSGAHFDDDDRHYDDEGRTIPFAAGWPVPIELLTLNDHPLYVSNWRIDWEKVAEAAGLDDEEAELLSLRLLGVSREQAMEGAESEEERKSIQAAYRRLTRKLPEIKDLLSGKKKLSANVPVSQKADTRIVGGQKPSPIKPPLRSQSKENTS